MLGSFRKGRANILIWALMAALVVGLAGFGIGVGGGITASDVARVGDQPVTTDDYVRALQQELRAYSQQLGRDLPMAEARDYGVDRQVLGRLINDAALDQRGRPPRPLRRRRRGARPGDGDPGLPGRRREFQPRGLHLRARAHRPAAGRVRGAAAARGGARAGRRRGAGRRDDARHRGADRARLPRREARLRMAPPRRRPPARAGRRRPPTPTSRPSTTPTPTATPGPRPAASPTPR